MKTIGEMLAMVDRVMLDVSTWYRVLGRDPHPQMLSGVSGEDMVKLRGHIDRATKVLLVADRELHEAMGILLARTQTIVEGAPQDLKAFN